MVGLEEVRPDPGSSGSVAGRSPGPVPAMEAVGGCLEGRGVQPGGRVGTCPENLWAFVKDESA